MTPSFWSHVIALPYAHDPADHRNTGFSTTSVFLIYTVNTPKAQILIYSAVNQESYVKSLCKVPNRKHWELKS